MFEYYSLFVFSSVLGSFNTVYLYKKFQVTAGTSLRASTLYLFINGAVSALVPAVILLARNQPLQLTPYSLLISLSLVGCSAADTVARLKAYEKGQIATVNTLSTVGTILLSCAWGILILHETLSVTGLVSIGIMLLSTILIYPQTTTRKNGSLLWLYLAVIVLGGAVSILTKQHQIETRFDTVDTLSLSVWIGLIRAILFAGVGSITMIRRGIGIMRFPKSATVYAAASSVISGSCYIITLLTNTTLPIVVTSPLGTGLKILMGIALPRILYREKMTVKQVLGVVLSFIGSLLFLTT